MADIAAASFNHIPLLFTPLVFGLRPSVPLPAGAQVMVSSPEADSTDRSGACGGHCRRLIQLIHITLFPPLFLRLGPPEPLSAGAQVMFSSPVAYPAERAVPSF